MDNKNWLGISKKKLKHDRQQSNHPFLLDLDSSIELKTNRQLINLENRQSISSENKLQDSPIKSSGLINKQKKQTYKQNVPTINILPSENCETDIALITIPNQEQQITQNEFIQLKQQKKIVNSPQNSQHSDDKNYPQLYQNINDKNSQENIISFPKEQQNNQNKKEENQQNYKQSSPQIHLITDILEKMSLHSSNSQQKYNKNNNNNNNTTPQNPYQINETEIISQKNQNPAQKQIQKSFENKNNNQNQYPKQNDFNLLSPQTNAYQINNNNTNNSYQTQSQKNININLNQDFKQQQQQQGNSKMNQSQSQSQSQFLFKKQSMPSHSQFIYNQSPRQRNGSSVCSYQNTGNNTVVKGGKRPTQLAPNPQAGQNLMGTSFMGRSFRKFTPINIIQNKFSQQNNNMISSSNNINRGANILSSQNDNNLNTEKNQNLNLNPQNQPKKNHQNNSINQKFRKIKDIYLKMKIKKILVEFHQLMIQNLKSRLYLSLKHQHFDIISDNSYYWKEIEIFTGYGFFRKMFKKIPIFNPNSLFLVIWDIFILFLIQIFLLGAPLQIVFDISWKSVSEYLYIFSQTVFIIDILLNFNKAYYVQGVSITRRSMIMKNYLKNSFFFDFIPIISTFISEENFTQDENQLLVYLQIFRIHQNNRKIQTINNYFNLFERYQSIIILLDLSYMIFCVAHLFGLGFIYVTKFENYGETWIDFRDGSKAYKDNDFSLYIDSLYFAFITMITVGYGDINPVTPIEKIYGILITLISCGIFGYALNVVGNILQHIQERNATVKKEKYLLLKYLEKKQINKNLQVKVIKYLDFVHQMEKEEVENSGGKLLNKISKKLKNEVLREYYLQILCANTFLIKYFSIEFLNTLAISMKDKMYGPEEIIFSQNEIDSRLIFLTKGELEVKFNKSIFNSSTKSRFKEQYSHIYFDSIKQYTPFSIKRKEIIGFDSVFNENPKKYTLTSKTISNITYISGLDFERLVKQFPSDFERFQMLKEDIRQGLLFPEKCFLCFKNWDHNGQNLQNNYYLSHQHQHMLKNYYSISNSLFDENQQNEIITIKTQTNKPSDTINPNKIQQNKFTHFKIRKKLHAIDNCYLINYIPNKQFLLNQYNDSRFCGQQMSANFENYYQPTPFQQPRNQGIRKSNSVNRKMKFRDFSHYKINQSVRKYRVENALQITFNQEELDEDFKNVDDREFLTSIPVIQIWDEVIRLKYIEANFPQDYQEEDIPIIQDRLFEYNEENQFQDENQYSSQTGSNFDSSDIENQIPYFSSQDDLQNVQKFQQFNRQNNMQLSQKNIPQEEPYDSQSSEGDFNSDSIVSPQTQNKQTIKKQPPIQNETSSKNQSLTKSKCQISKTVNLLGSSGSIGTIESAVSEDRTEHDVKNLMQQKLQSRQQTLQTQEQLPKISQNLQNSKNLKNSMTNSKTQPPKKLLTLNDSQFFERNQNEHLFSFSPDQLAFSKQQIDTEIPQLKLNQLSENQQQDNQQQIQESQSQFQLDQQKELEQTSQQFENFEQNQMQAKIPSIEKIKRQSQKQLSNLTLYRSKNNNQNDYNIRLIKDKEENQQPNLQRSNSSIDSFNFNQSFKKSNFSQQSYKRAQTKEIVKKPLFQKKDTFYDYVNKIKNNSFSKNSSNSSVVSSQKKQNQEKNKSPFDSNNVSILEVSNPFTQPNKNQIYKSQEIKSNQKTLQSSHKNIQKTQIDYQQLSTEQKDLQLSQKLSSPNKNEENYFTNTQEFTIYNNESEIASKKILDLQTEQNTQKTQKTSSLKKNAKSSHKSPHSNITQYPEREIKPSLKKKSKTSSSLQSQQIKNKLKQTAPNPYPNPNLKKNPSQQQQQQQQLQQQNSKKNPSQQQNSSQKFNNSRQSNKSLTQQPQTKTVQILLSQKYHNPNPYPNPNPNLNPNPNTSDSQNRPQKSFLRQNTVSQFSYTPKSTTALQFSLNQASKTTNINNSPMFKNHNIQQNLQNFQNRSKQNQRKSAFQNQLKLKKGSTNENIQPPAHINSSSTVNESQYQIFNFLSNNNMLNKNSLQILTDQKNMKGSFQQQIKNKSRSLSKNTILQQQSPLLYNNYKNFQTQHTDPLLFEKNLQNLQNQQKPEYIIGDLSLNNNSKFALNQQGNCDGDYEVMEKNFKDKQKQLLQYITDNFDRVKSYKVYRRQANITNIIQKIEQIQIKLYQHNQNPQLSQQNNQNIESCQSIRTYRSSIQPQNQSVLRKSKYYYKSNNNIPNNSIKQQSQNTPSSNYNNYQFEDIPKEDGISGFQQYENQKNNRNQDNQQNPQNDFNQILKRNSSSNNDPNCLDDLINAQDQVKMQQSENPSQNKQLDAKINQQLFTINSLNASCQNNLSNNSKSNNTESQNINKNKNQNQYQIQSKNPENRENSVLQKQVTSKQSQNQSLSQNLSQIQAQNNSQQTFSIDLKQSKKNYNLQTTSPQKRFSHNINPNSLREQRKKTFIASKTDKNISSNINAHFNVNKSNMTNNSKSTNNNNNNNNQINNINNVNKNGTLNNSNSNKSSSKNNVLQFPNSQKNEKRRSSVFDIIEKKKLQILVQKYQEQDTQFKDTPRDDQKSEKLINQQKQQSNDQ